MALEAAGVYNATLLTIRALSELFLLERMGHGHEMEDWDYSNVED